MQYALLSGVGGAVREAGATTRRPEILSLTSLRCLAALEVVLLHTLFELGGKPAQGLPSFVVSLLTRGGAAVSFFFVLSGFILAYTYADEHGMKGTPRKFWRARFARIYPLYALGFVLDAPRVVVFFLKTATLKVALVKVSVAGLAYLSLLQSWHPRVTNTWNTPGWSLSTEAFFYAVFPVLLVWTLRWPFRRLFGVVIAGCALPMLGYFVLIQWRLVDSDAPSFLTFWHSFPPLRLPEFALGVATGRLLLTGRLADRETLLRWLGAAALLFILALSARPSALPGAVETGVQGPLFAIVILALASGALPAPKWLNSPTLVLLGRASYAVYILHQPLKTIFLAGARWARLDAPTPALLIAYLAFIELSCVGLFLYFEDPVRRYLTRSQQSSRRQ